jgi:hypothetical protein
MSRLPSVPSFGGGLPFKGGSSPFPDLSGTPEQSLANLGPAYKSAYESARGFNEALYGLADTGYRNLAAYQTSAAEAIQGGYTGLTNQVLGQIRQTGEARGTAIDDAYAQANAVSQQSLINRGLGNTTVLDSQRRSATTDRERARTQLSNDLSEMTAGYQSNLGLAGLRSQEQLAQQGLGVGYRHMDFLNSIQAPYPDAGMYAGLAQQYGGMIQSGLDRGLIRDQLAMQGQLASRQIAQADAASGGGGGFESPTFGGGYARGTGSLAPPMANYGGGGAGQIMSPTMGGFGAGPVSSAGFDMGGGGYFSPPPLAGVSPGESKPYYGPLEEGVETSYSKPSFGSDSAGEYRGGDYSVYDTGGQSNWTDYLF